MNNFFDRIFLDNTISAYLWVTGSIIVVWLLIKLIKKQLIVLLKRLTGKTETMLDDLIIEAAEKFLIPYLYLGINYNIITHLQLSVTVKKVLSVAMMVITTYFFVRLVNYVIQHLIVLAMRRRNEPEERIRQVQGMLTVVKALVWCVGILMFVDNLGYDVKTILAGLGVGGIAVALAAQNILSDLFSYLVIFFDKPFEIGDYIVADNCSGVVEKIGIKTSHVRSLDGQQLIMPNSEIVKSVIQNYKRLEKRRVVFSIGVVYNTPSQKLRAIPAMIKSVISNEQHTLFDRTHFKSFGDFSINYEIVYFITSPDYLVYANTHEKICLNIFEKFEQEGIEFAFPTQTIILDKQGQ